jgi:hypothetical protein
MMKVKRKHVLCTITMFSFAGLGMTLFKLLLQDFPSRHFFAITYFGYVVAALVFVHSAFFFANLELKEIGGKGLSKNVPRYLDHVVTALIAIGLVQIFFSEDIFAKYIEQISGTKPEIAMSIKQKAAAHLKDDCKNKEAFTVDYCKKLDAIVKAQNIDEYVSKTVSKDSEFLEHSIGYVVSPEGPMVLRSPIERYVNQYTSLGEYGVAPQRSDHRSAWSWMALVLLPLVLAFRATKTSLELYGDLS